MSSLTLFTAWKILYWQLIPGATVIDDILGIIVLAVVASLAKTGVVDIGNVVYLIFMCG